jgi:hypothetical protein
MIHKTIFRGRRTIAAGLLALTVLLGVIFTARVVTRGTSGTPVPEPGKAAQDGPLATGEGTDEASGVDTSKKIEDALDRAVEAGPASRPRLKEIDLRLQSQQLDKKKSEYWRKEDEIYDASPRYPEVRDEYRKKAQELLAALPAADPGAMLELAQRELDAFWDAGGLASAQSYEHGYLAWAVMEIACEREGENFALLRGLSDAASTMTIALDASEKEFRKEAFAVLWPVVQRQHELIVSGKAPSSPEAMIAMGDWTNMCMMKALFDGGSKQEWAKVMVPGYEWLVANAEACGCGKTLPDLRARLSFARDGQPAAAGFFSTGAIDLGKAEGLILWAQHHRRMVTIRGSRRYRGSLLKMWELDVPLDPRIVQP